MNEPKHLAIEKWRHHRRRARSRFASALKLIGLGVGLGALSMFVTEAFTLALIAGAGSVYCFLACAYHHTKTQLCPACSRFFGEAAEFQKGESPGLSMYGKVSLCPFCKVTLEIDKENP